MRYVIFPGREVNNETLVLKKELTECCRYKKYPIWNGGVILVGDGVPISIIESPMGRALVIGYIFNARHNVGQWTPKDGPSFSGRRQALSWVHKTYWGDYIACTGSCSTGLSIIRSCSGAMPCYVYRGADPVVFSAPEEVRSLLLARGRINWENVSRNAYFSRYTSSDTAIVDLEDIVPGQIISLEAGTVTRSTIWSPTITAMQSVAKGVSSEEVQQTIVKSVTAHVAPFKRTGLLLSGGIDSSIILASLCSEVQAKRSLVGCLNIRDMGTGSNEWRYARVIAEKNEVALVGADVGTPNNLHGALLNTNRLTVRPSKDVLTGGSRVVIESVVQEWGLDAIISGGGGDAVFFCPRAGLVPADYLRHVGVRGLWLECVRDALRSRNSYMEIGRTLIRYGILGRPYDPIAGLRRSRYGCLTAGAMDTARASTLLHPWAQEAIINNLPAARCWQIFGIADALYARAYPGGAGDARTLMPILSRPILEKMLSIPTWKLVPGVRDRELVRQAFKGVVPDLILDRTGKGTASHYFNMMYRSNSRWMRKFLADGALVAGGILDPDKVNVCFDCASEPPFSTQVRLLEYVALEHWLRNLLSFVKR